MDWALEFYTKQNQWSGVYEEAINDGHRLKAGWIEELVGPGKKRILELGAGGGQVAAAMAMLGHDVTAVEQAPTLSAHAQKLATEAMAGRLTVVQASFYTVELTGLFDVVCYYDGFGIGEDADQRRLLKRVAAWLTSSGSALIEIGTPWYAASVNGRGWRMGQAERRYNFDADGCRWLDTWWPIDQPEGAVQQSLRCYSPADLRLLLEPTGLYLTHVRPGGTMDWEQRKWLPAVPLGKAMGYVAQLCLVR
ncbi:MAG: methyltransferase domain-containing protein [Caldilineaceae bacterium]